LKDWGSRLKKKGAFATFAVGAVGCWISNHNETPAVELELVLANDLQQHFLEELESPRFELQNPVQHLMKYLMFGKYWVAMHFEGHLQQT